MILSIYGLFIDELQTREIEETSYMILTKLIKRSYGWESYAIHENQDDYSDNRIYYINDIETIEQGYQTAGQIMTFITIIKNSIMFFTLIFYTFDVILCRNETKQGTYYINCFLPLCTYACAHRSRLHNLN